MAASRIGVVVAVWADGGISAHRQLGFRRRSLGDGEKEEPLVTFVTGPETPSAWTIQERLDSAYARRQARGA